MSANLRPSRRKSTKAIHTPPSPPTSSSAASSASTSRAHSPAKRTTDERATWQRLYKTYEVPRKTLHSAIGLAAIGLYASPHVTPTRLLSLGIPATAVIVSADLLRFNSPAFASVYERHLGYLMRPQERKGWNGVIFYLVGALLVLGTLPTDIATLSVLLLSWCDTAASTVGRALGHHGPQLRPGKSLIGTFAAFMVGAAATAFFYTTLVTYRPQTPPSWDPATSSLGLAQVSVLGGVVAALSEAVDVFGLDDNLTIPVLSGGLLWAVLCWAGYGHS
ncbi:hypothetical protein BCR37DRAFT_162463 [Protomyces lactucae-debilis]|uniref:Cytidylyltransferase family-domain-containing protein n=1 Tax=Protomyces lactucae-debilis TaxID=2754530 RepID=A0A1Y2EYD3_PROLT|nr:uncharacterized protein BCR37DRAFT_162463 [Protomyces lactucae-debilis]ORY76641.1 hypothetical protein BCR37DRAFT_162463 [Protomyces lactucae-debilis]